MRYLTILAAVVALAGSLASPAWSVDLTPWPNGGGMVCVLAGGDSSFIQPTAYIDSGSRVCGSVHISGAPQIIGSAITGGDIAGTPTIRNSTFNGHWEWLAIRANAEIVNSVVKGGLISYNAKVINSKISGRSGRILDNAIVRNSELLGGQVSGNAKVIKSRLYVGSEVSGSAVVRHATITGTGKVDCGRWVNITVTTDRRGECGRNGKERRNPVQDLIGDPLTVINPENTQTSE